MSSIIRRAGAKLLTLIERTADPGGSANEVQVYPKDVSGTSQLFAQDSAGTVHQITPLASQIAEFDPNQATFPLGAATAGSRNDHPVIEYDDTTAEFVDFHGTISNDYRGGNITVDIDWVAATATSGVTQWAGQVERLAAGGTDIDVDSFAAQQTGNGTANGTSGIITRTSITFTVAQADSIAAGDAFRMRIQRNAAAGADTMVGDAQLLRVSVRQ